MKVLYLTEILPYPLDSGGKIKTYATLKMLSKKHNITLVTFVGEKRPKKSFLYEIKKLGIKAHCVYSPKRKVGYKSTRKEMIKTALSFSPFLIDNMRSRSFKDRVRKILFSETFDVIHIDHLAISQYLPEEKTCFWYYEEHNIEHLIYWNLAKSAASFKSKLFYFYEFLSLYLYERKQIKKFDKIFAISYDDKKVIKAKFKPKAKMDVLEVTIQAPRITKDSDLPASSIIFIGSLLWPPNLSAVTWFCQDILPHIHKTYPRLNLIIVGHKNEEIENKLSQFPKCKLIGYVDKIDQYLDRRRHIFILPFIFGEGVRVKALMAMAHGVPLVSTAAGVRGIEAKGGRDYLEATGSRSFSCQTIKLIKDANLRKELGANGRKLVRKNYAETIASSALDRY